MPLDNIPTDTQVTTGNEPPTQYFEAEFVDPGPQSHQFPAPSVLTKSIFITVTPEVVDATLYFNNLHDPEQQYYYHVLPDSNALLTFPTGLNVTEVTLQITAWIDGDSTAAPAAVGYVTIVEPPTCFLPTGAQSAGATSFPSNAVGVGSPSATVGSTLDVPDPSVPISSFFVGLDDSEAKGFAIAFTSAGTEYSCPIDPAMIEISFEQPNAIVDVELEYVGPWGEVGYSDSPENVNAFLRYNNSKQTSLPAGSQIQLNTTAPETYSLGFLAGQYGTFTLPVPTGEVTSVWVRAGQYLVEPYLYFKVNDVWYSTLIDQESLGMLISFADDLELTELYASADNAVDADQISIGYLYPTVLSAHAGLDQTVEELQLVYLDGSDTVGPEGGLSFSWIQIDGPKVVLQGADTATPSFTAPETDSDGIELSFKLTVTDSKGERSQDSVVINVTNDPLSPNDPPVVGALTDVTVNEGSQVVFAPIAYDPDGDALRYSWTQIAGTAVSMVGADTANLSFESPQVSIDSTLSFRLTVTDELGNYATEDVLVYVLDVPEIVPTPTPVLSAGGDQEVSEGSTVVLQGSYTGVDDGDTSAFSYQWEQLSGIPVTLSNPSSLNASFVAPAVDDGTTEKLTFELRVINVLGGSIVASDEVSVVVDSVTADDEPEPTEIISSGPSSFNIVRRTDVQPPEEIHTLVFQGSGPSQVVAPPPAGELRGIWVNTTNSGIADVRIGFSYIGRQYSPDHSPVDQTVAYVFNSSLALQDIRVSGVVSGEQQMQLGYYYDSVPLVSPLVESPPLAEASSPDLPIGPRAEFERDDLIARNLVLAGATAVGVPAGIAVALKMASSRRNRMLATSRHTAKMLFPKNDPVASEAEKVKPVIEELEKILGRNLDTAVNATELLDRFAGGGGKSTSSKK